MSYEREYTQKAFEALKSYLYLLPTEVQRSVLLAGSIVASHGYPTGKELAAELGDNWVLAKRTKSIVAKYGQDVKCYSQEAYKVAERRAIEKRFPLNAQPKRTITVTTEVA